LEKAGRLLGGFVRLKEDICASGPLTRTQRDGLNVDDAQISMNSGQVKGHPGQVFQAQKDKRQAYVGMKSSQRSRKASKSLGFAETCIDEKGNNSA